MAEFCNNCAEEHDFPVDIDVHKIFETIDEGYYRLGYLCEGCGLIGIAKTQGKLRVAYLNRQIENTPIVWRRYTLKPNKDDKKTGN